MKTFLDLLLSLLVSEDRSFIDPDRYRKMEKLVEENPWSPDDPTEEEEWDELQERINRLRFP